MLVLRAPEGVDYPGGKIQVGEDDIIESLKREVREESGLEIRVDAPFATWKHTFPPSHPLAGKTVYLVGYKCDYVSGDVRLNNEHDHHQWVTKDTYQDIDDGTPYFDILHQYFR